MTAGGVGIYAPTLRHHNGTYYLVTTLNALLPPDLATAGPRSFYVTTTDIFNESSWSEPVYIDQPGIDPDIFFDDDGKVYLTLNVGRGISMAEIDITTGNSITAYDPILNTSVPCPLPQLAEGPHIYKINGTYYLLTAEVGTEAFHQSRIYRSRHIRGPWESSPTNPLLFNGRDLSQGLLATGHADMVEGLDGKWWAVFLASRHYGPSNVTGWRQLGRETFLSPIEWHDDGWPTFNNGEPITENMEGYLYDLPRPKLWRDDFNGRLADRNYYNIRTPMKDPLDLTSRPGFARVRGNPYTLSQRSSPAALLRKQADVNVTFSTELTSYDPDPTHPLRQEAGASIYLNDFFHNDIGVAISNVTNNKAIVLRISEGPVQLAFSPIALSTLLSITSPICENTTSIPHGVSSGPSSYIQNVTLIEDSGVAAGLPVTFFIEAKDIGYRLGYAVNGSQPKYVGQVSNRWLDAGSLINFAGSHFAIYNAGGNYASLANADFQYIQTELN